MLEKRAAEVCVVPDVAGDERKVVFQSGGGNQAIGGVERTALPPPFTFENAPVIGDHLRHRENATGK